MNINPDTIIDQYQHLKKQAIALKLDIHYKRYFLAVKDLITLISMIVTVIEKSYNTAKPMTSDEKVESAIQIIRALYDVPLIPAWLEEQIYRIIIWTIVKKLNLKFGHNWSQHK